MSAASRAGPPAGPLADPVQAAFSHAGLAAGARAHLLGAPARRQILDLVARQPGLPVGELQGLLGIGWGTLHHHLRKLEEAGLLRTVQSGRRRLVHLASARGPPEGFALLRGRTARRVALAILRHPGAGIGALAEAVGDSPRVVYYHVKRLVDAGLVVAEGGTRYARLVPAPSLGDLLGTTPAPGEYL